VAAWAPFLPIIIISFFAAKAAAATENFNHFDVSSSLPQSVV
jgi:hypothetical protein